MNNNKETQRIVIKIGTSTLTSGATFIDDTVIKRIAHVVNELKIAGHEVILVSSGSIAAGISEFNLKSRPQDIPTMQACASVGQAALIEKYRDAFLPLNLVVGEVLLTRNDTANRSAYLHARDTFNRLLELDAVPIVNENDSVAVDEITFGDNDTLAALIATLVHADLVILLSDIDGLYTANPRNNPDATLISLVEEVTPDILAISDKTGSSLGSGGMYTKVRAARALMSAGISMVIANGNQLEDVSRIASGEFIGTRFVAHSGERRMNSRKMWIALASKIMGRLTIDEGAADALLKKGTSLLAVGIKDIAGNFDAGDFVQVATLDGVVIGRGQTSFSSAQLAETIGLHQDEIAKRLPKLAGRPVIHRDELAIFL